MEDASLATSSAATAMVPSTSSDSVATRYFQVRGTVQNVMFRQTVIRAMAKRELSGGATNDKSDKKLVHVTLLGPIDAINELMDTIGSGKKLNDWGAMASQVREVSDAEGKSMTSHQVTTQNVDSKKWNPNCVMFI